MKIAILTSGILPVPAVQGGAVENLIDFYLEYNNQNKLHDITVYSIKHPNTQNHSALLSDVNHYHYIDTTSFFARIKRAVCRLLHKNGYYNYFIEFFFEQACKHIKKQPFDCIILENRPGYASELSKQINSKLVLHLHNDLLNKKTKLNKNIFNNLDLILTVSNYIKSRVCTIKETNKVTTIYNGIDLQHFTVQTKSDLSRQDIGFATDDFILLYSGRINKNKGVSELIDAMLQLKNFHDIKLLILGSSFFGNANSDNEFVKSIKSKSSVIANRIAFTGFIPYHEMPKYLRLADIAIIPSIWDDPFPTTVLEAQAMGLPIITTTRGGIPEEVTKDNAILLDTDIAFIDNLANAILNLYNHPEKRERMACLSLENAKLFNKERFARDFFNALKDI